MSNLTDYLDQRVIRSQIRALLEYGVDLADTLAEAANAVTTFYPRIADKQVTRLGLDSGRTTYTDADLVVIHERATWQTLCAQRDRIVYEVQRVKDLLQRLQEVLGILLDDYPAAIRYVEEARQQIGQDEFGSAFPKKQRDRNPGEFLDGDPLNLVKSPTFIGTYDHN